MAKAPQVLQIEPPSEIVFKGPFDDVVTSQLSLSNPTEREVCFKVKTTAPKQYCVKPNSGVVPPNATVNVAIMLQPLNEEDGDSAHAAAKHKFMVQTCYMPVDNGGEPKMPVDAVWRAVEPNELMDTKLKVMFDGVTGGAQQHYTAQSTFSHNVTDAAAAHSQKTAPSAESTELRKAFDDRKRLQDELANLERENQQLRERLARTEVSASRAFDGASDKAADPGAALVPAAGVNMYQALGAALVALILGLILGRLVF